MKFCFDQMEQKSRIKAQRLFLTVNTRGSEGDERNVKSVKKQTGLYRSKLNSFSGI